MDAILGVAMTRAARAARFACMDSHHELESNYLVRAEMERWGGKIYKKYRIFRKKL